MKNPTVSQKRLAIHDMHQDDEIHLNVLAKEKDIIEFLNEEKDEEINLNDSTAAEYWA